MGVIFNRRFRSPFGTLFADEMAGGGGYVRVKPSISADEMADDCQC
jgi:hypothetical protein